MGRIGCIHRLFVPLEHLGEKELAKTGVGFGLGHEVQEFIGVAEEGVLDAAIELVAAKMLGLIGFERGLQTVPWNAVLGVDVMETANGQYE